jgi:hypothetical protein
LETPVETPASSIGYAMEKSLDNGVATRLHAMEKSLANGGLETIASMTKKRLGRRRRAHGTNLGARALKCPTAFWEHPFALVAKEIRMVRHLINLHENRSILLVICQHSS